jgi:hypothetical protein
MAEGIAADVRRQAPLPEGYEAPRVETVLTSEVLDREVIYAGSTSLL